MFNVHYHDCSTTQITNVLRTLLPETSWLGHRNPVNEGLRHTFNRASPTNANPANELVGTTRCRVQVPQGSGGSPQRGPKAEPRWGTGGRSLPETVGWIFESNSLDGNTAKSTWKNPTIKAWNTSYYVNTAINNPAFILWFMFLSYWELRKARVGGSYKE